MLRKSFVYALIGLVIHLVLGFLSEDTFPFNAIGYFVTIGLIGAHLEKQTEEKKSKEDGNDDKKEVQ